MQLLLTPAGSEWSESRWRGGRRGRVPGVDMGKGMKHLRQAIRGERGGGRGGEEGRERK